MKWLFLLLLVPTVAFSQENSTAFPDLKAIKVDKRWNARILYNPAITTIINKDMTHPEGGIKTIHVLETKINKSDQRYLIEYNEGASDDPQFIIYKEAGGKLTNIFFSFGTGLIIPGNGYVYISGHTNNMFDERKKYAFNNGKLTEVKQPFRYVGLDTKTTREVTLYSSQEQKGIVANLSVGSPVTILLNDHEGYLIKTPFGLVGWVRIKNVSNEESPFTGLFYAGD